MAGTTYQRDHPDGRQTRRPDVPLKDLRNVLVFTPSLSDGAHHAYQDLHSITPDEEYNAVSLIFTTSHLNRADWWTDVLGQPPTEAVVIDATPSPDNVSDPLECGSTTVRGVDAPNDLTQIGIELSQLPEMLAPADTTVVCVRSLTTLLQYVETEPAYRFLNLMIDRIVAMGGVGHFHIDPTAHSEQTINTLASLFDAVLEPNDQGELAPPQ